MWRTFRNEETGGWWAVLSVYGHEQAYGPYMSRTEADAAMSKRLAHTRVGRG